MKRTLFLVLIVALLAACTQAPDAQKAQTAGAKEVTEAGEATTVNVDMNTSAVNWIGTKLTGRHNGTIKMKNANLKVKGSQLVGGEFVLDMASITCLDLEGENKKKLEEHLKSEDFFDVAKYPEAKFVITGIKEEKTDSTTHRIEGNLTIKDITKNISFGAKVDVSNPKAPKAYANFNINRKDWKVMYEGKKDDLIRDEVNFTIDLQTSAS